MSNVTLKLAGPSCLNVVAIEIGGTTAIEFHFSGSTPAWIARVAKVLLWGLNPSMIECYYCKGRQSIRADGMQLGDAGGW